MPIIISTYCRVNRNGSMDINTDPAFGIITTTTTTTTTTINLNDYACVSSAGSPVNTTYQFYDSKYIPGGPNGDPFGLQISLYPSGEGSVWIIGRPGDEIYYYNGNTNPAPAFPWLETSWRLAGNGSNPLPTVTRGPC